ncbi:hypothetical protein OG225_08205 [Nocardia sp. NBC_01377]|uniref:hypothetical protein n=1 Tax=Nocardia sp. NBC_01377 TaxID=2903595 RepID=UPI003255DF63
MTRPYRLVIWGPGDMGGRALLAALRSPEFDVVGVKVFSPHKDGRDIGELVGLAPTTPSLLRGADADVVDPLESGKNVVSAVPARVTVRAGGTVIEPGTVGVIHMTYRGYIGDRLFMTNEECWHVGPGNAHLGPDHPRSLSGGHVITLDGTPCGVEMRNEMDDEAYSADWSAVTDISVRAMLAALPELCAAPPGVAMPDLTPRYRLENALAPSRSPYSARDRSPIGSSPESNAVPTCARPA